MLATVPWGYIAVAVLVIVAVVASPVLIVLVRGARSVAYTYTDEFRLSLKHTWTEVDHIENAGSSQTMRLPDGTFVFVSVGLTTTKLFVTPDLRDSTRYRELKTFSLSPDRPLLSEAERRAQDELLLERVRRAIGWPNSEVELCATLGAIDDALLADVTKRDA